MLNINEKNTVSDKVNETLRQVRTINEQTMMVEAVSILEAGLYKKNETDSHDALVGILSERLYRATLQILSDEILKNSANFRRYLLELKSALGEMYVINFEVAFDPDEDLILTIHNWILAELGVGTTIDFYLNPSVIGGAVLIYKGEYFDFTFSRILEKNFERSWDEISKKYAL